MKSIIIRKVEIYPYSRNEIEFRWFAVIVNIHVHNGGVVFCSDFNFYLFVLENSPFFFDSKNN